MTSLLAIDEYAMADLVAEVFTGLLGEMTEPPYASAPADEALPAVGYLAVRGGWHAEVVFACSRAAAVDLAQRLFMLPSAEVRDGDLRDVLGEIANVLGGNLKSLMPGPSALSLPNTGLDGAVEAVYTGEALRLDLGWYGQPMRVLVLEPAPTTPSHPE